MTIEEINNFLKYMETCYGRTWPPDSRRMLVDGLKDEAVEAGRRGAKDLIASETFLPAPVVVLKVVREWGSELRMQETKRQRRENQETENVLTRDYTPDLAKKSCQLVRAAAQGKITGEKLHEGMMEMARLYPNQGWATHAARYKREVLDKKTVIVVEEIKPDIKQLPGGTS